MKNKVFKKVVVCSLIFGELFNTTSVYALTKEESVYVKLNQDGSKNNVVVSEHLFDYRGDKIYDKSTLENIKNVNGDEKFNLNGSDLVWETKGEDIYYQGYYEKDLPVSLNVKYFLDDKESNVNEMLGKKGHVRILLTYENHLSEKVRINGKTETIYVPFAIVTTSILNNSENKNIQVTNGRVVDNGITSIVAAVSSPGLYESLNINDLKDINKVEISYDTDNFSLNSIYSVATTNMFNDSNLSIFGKINTLYDSINLLQSNMNTIVDGANALADGTNQINDGITILNGKIQELTKKYNYYRNQDKDTLKEGLIKIVNDNIKKITPALAEDITNETSRIIKDNKEKLAENILETTKENTKYVLENEIKKVIRELNLNNLINTAKEDINSLTTDPEIISLINSLKEELNKEIITVVNTVMNEINNSLSIKASDEEITMFANKYGVSEEIASQMINDIQSNTVNKIKEKLNNANISQKIVDVLNSKESVNVIVNNLVSKINEKLNNIINNNSKLKEYEQELKEKILNTIKNNINNENLLNFDAKEYINNLVDKIIDNTTSELMDRYTDEYTGVIVSNIIEKQFSEKNVDSKLRELLNIHENDISDKVKILDNAINTLSDSLNKLNDGSNMLKDGMTTLADGLNKYNNEGIKKLSNVVNGDLKGFQKKFEEFIRLGKEYKTIDEINNNTSGSSRIIFMIDSVSKKVEETEDKIVDEKKSLWDKIEGLFN